MERGPSAAPLRAELGALSAAQLRMERVLSELVAAQRAVEASLEALPGRLRAEGASSEEGSCDQMASRVALVGEQTTVPTLPSLRDSCSGWSSTSMAKQVSCEESSEDPAPASFGLVAPMLPLHWPRSLKAQQDLMGAAGYGQVVFSPRRATEYTTRLQDPSERKPHAGIWWLTDPNSLVNLAVAIFSVLVLIHDLCIIPYTMAWELPFTGYVQLSTWLSASFWTLDTCLSFLRGVYNEEQPVVIPREIARQYLRTYFLPDAAVCMCDWVNLMLMSFSDGSSVGGLRILRLAKLGRFLRIAMAFRVMRALRTLLDVLDRQISDTWQWLVSSALLLCAGVLVTHLVACAWMALGQSASSDTGARWIDYPISFNGEIVPFAEADAGYQYVTSYHWSLAVLTQGAIEFPCVSTYERLFNIGCLMCGFLVGSMFISSLSARMVEYQTLQRDRVQQLRRLRRYLGENRVAQHVAVITLRQATQRVKAQQPLTPKDVPVLEMLSSALRKEIHSSICRPQLMRHPLFRVLGSIQLAWLEGFCRDVVEIDFLGESDELFSPGTTALAAHMLIGGQMLYTQVPESSPVQERSVREVTEGTWLCESALWSQWIHVGTAESTSHCRLLTLRTGPTIEFLQRHHTIRSISKAYCLEFHRRIVNARPPLAEWPDDLEVPGTAFEELVASMPLSATMIIGFQACDQLLSSARGREGVFHVSLNLAHDCHFEDKTQKIRDEIQEGRCSMCMDAAGKVVRSTSIVLLRIKDGNGHYLWQLGKVEDGQLLARAKMPGTKRHPGESPTEAVARLFAAGLAPLANCTIKGMESSVTEAVSRAYGVHTKYCRTVCDTALQGPFAAAHCTLRQSLDGCFSPKGRRKAASTVAHAEAFADRRVYVVHHEGASRLYAWLSEQDIEHLSSAQGEQILNDWLCALQLPPDEEADLRLTL